MNYRCLTENQASWGYTEPGQVPVIWGQFVDRLGISPNPEKAKAVLKMKQPTSITEIWQFELN